MLTAIARVQRLDDPVAGEHQLLALGQARRLWRLVTETTCTIPGIATRRAATYRSMRPQRAGAGEARRDQTFTPGQLPAPHIRFQRCCRIVERHTAGLATDRELSAADSAQCTRLCQGLGTSVPESVRIAQLQGVAWTNKK